MQTSRNLSGNIIVGNGVSDLTLHGNTYLKGILDIVTSNPSTALTIRRTPNSTPAFTISDLGDFTINGSLTVVGNTTTIGSTSSNNPFFEINNAATDDSVDTGTYSKYIRSATSYYTGFARKAGTGDIIFFYDATVKPINVLQTNTYQYANIYAGTVRSTSIVNAGALTTYGTADIATNLIYADSLTSRVGIKTASPLNAMDINGALAVGSYAATQTAPSNGLIVSGSVGIGTFNPTSRLHVSGSGSGVRISGQSSGEAGLSVGQTAELQVDSSTTAGGRFIVRSNGNVGINNASTDRLLRITDSSSSTTTSQLYIEQSSTGDAWLNLGLTGSSHYAIGIDNSDSDKLKFGYHDTVASGVDTGTLLTLTSAGSLGLGTTTPNALVDVLTTGTQLRLSNTSLIFSTLTTDASGNLNITTGGPQISYSGNIVNATWTGTTIATTRGGTGLTSYTLGDLLFASASNTLSTLSGNTTTTRKFLRQTGNGSVSTAPVWDTIIAADVPGSALTATGDTNINVVIGGNDTTALLRSASIAVSWTGVLAESRGGTNQSTYTLGDILFASAANTLSKLAGNTTSARKFLRQTGNGTISAAPVWDTILAGDVPGSGLTVVNDSNISLVLDGAPNTALLSATSITVNWSGQLPTTRGGTGLSSYSTGDIIYASATNTLSKLAGNTTNTRKFLRQVGSGGLSTAPVWDTITASDVVSYGLTTSNDTNITLVAGGTPSAALLSSVSLTVGWTGTLAETRGGTGQFGYTKGDILYANNTNALTVLPGNTTTTKKFLTQTGTGSASAAPTWDTITLTDVITTGALTSSNDSNVTLTVGGNAATALLRSASITAGWTGLLPTNRGGTGLSTYTTGDIIYSSSSNTLAALPGNTTATRRFLRQTGNGVASTAPAWDLILGTDVSGSAITSTDDTNIGLGFTGSPNVGLLRPVNIQVNWSGSLAATRGGTGISTYTTGDILYANAPTALAKLPGNTAPVRKYLMSIGDGTTASVPVWDVVAPSDVKGEAFSAVNDTNVTATLTGQPTTALLDPLTFTLGWTGQLSAARGGTGLGFYAIGDILYAGGSTNLTALTGNNTTTKKFLTQTGTGIISQPPAWNTITAADVPGSALTTVDDSNVTLTLGGNASTALLHASSISVGWSGQLSVLRGGTGTSTVPTNGQILIGRTATSDYIPASLTGTSNRISVTPGSGSITLDISSSYTGQATITTVGIISSGSWQSTAVGPTFGGTGQSTYSTGDILYSNAPDSLTKLSAAASGNALISGTTPSWGKIGLTTHVSGTLPVANGGTGVTSYNAGGLVYASGTTSISSLVAVIAGSVLISAGASSAPAWSTNLPVTSAAIGASYTASTPPTNGLIVQGSTSIGSSSATSLFNVGSSNQFQVNSSGQVVGGTWQGTVVAPIYGGTGTTTAPTNGQILIGRTTTSDYIPASISGTSGRITVTPGSGSITLNIDTAYVGQATITTVGTISTGTWSASTIAVTKGGTGTTTVPTNGQILIGRTATSDYIPASISGTASRLLVTNGSGTIALDIDSAYVGQTSITTLGTISTGTWSASTIAVIKGGTGTTTVPTNGQILIGRTGTSDYIPANISGTASRLLVTNGSGTIALDIDSAYVGQTSITTLGTVTTGTWSASTIAVTKGGTGTSTVPTNGQILIGRTGTSDYIPANISGTSSRLLVTNGSGTIALDIDSAYVGQTSITTLGTISTGTWQGTVVSPIYGGTGQSTYTTGDMLYSNSSNSLTKLSIVTSGSVLISGTTPSWSTNLPVTSAAIGVSYIATAPPTNGLIVQGQTAFGTSSALSNTAFTINPSINTYTYGLYNSSTLTAVDGSFNQYGSVSAPVFTPVGATTKSFATSLLPDIRTTTSMTTALAGGLYINNTVSNAAFTGTITSLTGLYIDTGTTSTGTVTTSYGMFVKNPSAGTYQYSGYFEGPTDFNGMVVNRNAITGSNNTSTNNFIVESPNCYVYMMRTSSTSCYMMSNILTGKRSSVTTSTLGTMSSNIVMSPTGKYMYGGTTATFRIIQGVDTGSPSTLVSFTPGDVRMYGVTRMALSPDGQYAYLLATSSDISARLITVIQDITTASPSILTSMTLPDQSGQCDIVITPNGKYAYITSFNSNITLLQGIDTNNISVVTVYNFGATSSGYMSITPDGNILYVGDTATSNMRYFTGASSGSPVLSATVLTVPGDVSIMTISPNGQVVWVYSATNKSFSIVTNAMTTPTIITTLFTVPTLTTTGNMAITPDGYYLFVPNTSSSANNIYIIKNASSSTPSLEQTLSMGVRTSNIAITPANITLNGNTTVLRGSVGVFDTMPGSSISIIGNAQVGWSPGTAAPSNSLIVKNKLGIGTITPRTLIDSLSTSGSQLRLTYTDNSVYSDFTTNSSGYLGIVPSGSRVGIGTTSPSAYFSVGSSSQFQINSSGQITSGTWQATAIAPLYGGTGTSTLPTNGQILIGRTATSDYIPANISGTSSRLLVTNGSGTITLDIDSAYVGQTSITTLGTITTGTWSASTIAVIKGGTGTTTVPTNGQILIGRTATSDYIPANISGTSSRLLVTNGSGTITLDIDSAYVGQTSITTLGTVTTGTWNASVVTPTYGGTGTGTTFTQGSVVFSGASGVYSQNNSKFFWDNTNNRLGIGTALPTSPLEIYDISSTSTIKTTGAGMTINTVGTAVTTAALTLNSYFGGSTFNNGLSLGWKFTVGASTMYVTHLGHFTNGGVGVFTSGSREVAIYTTGGTQLAYLNISYGAAEGDFIYGALSSALELTAGTTYYIITNIGANVPYSTANSYNLSGLTSAVGVYTLSSGSLTFGNFVEGGTPMLGPGFKYSASNPTAVITDHNVSITGKANAQLRINYTTNSVYTDFTTNSSGYLGIVSTGNRVGIGTTSPSAYFSVGASSQFQINSSGQISSGTWQATAIAPLYGGTGTTTLPTNGQILIGRTATSDYIPASISGTSGRIAVTPGSGSITLNIDTAYVGQATITTLGTVTTGTWNATTIAVGYGGTGQTSYTTGDILYASSGSVLSKLPGVATGNALISGGTSTAPSWGKIGLTTHISGTLGIGNGGTGLTATPTNGQLLIGNGTNYTLASLSGTGSRISVTPGSGSITLNIDTAYVGQATITTLGTVTTGTWNATVLTPTYGGTGSSTTFTQGSIIFSGASGVYSQNNANFFWDNTNNRLGIGRATPTTTFDLTGTFRSTGSTVNMLTYSPSTTIAINNTTCSSSFTSGSNLVVGLRFTVGASDLYVTHLGHFQGGGVNVFPSGTRQVAIYDTSGTQLAIATINSATTPESNFCYTALGTPITLVANTDYVILATEPAGVQIGDATTPSYSGISVVSWLSAISGGMSYTTSNIIASSGYATGGFKYTASQTTLYMTNQSASIGSTTTTSLFNVGTAAQFQVNSSGQVVSGTWQGTAIAFGYGGTGQSTYTTGDILYYNGSALAKLAIGSSTNVLTVSGGVPVWAAPAASVSTVSGTTNQITSTGTTSVTLSLPSTLVTPGSLSVLANATSVNNLSVSSVFYATGTASQSTTTVTGSGTAFTSSMIGMKLVFANGVSAGFITVVTSGTVLTVSTSQTVTSQAFTIYECSLQSVSSASSAITGNVGVGTVAPPSLLSVCPVNTSISCPGTASQSAFTVTGSGTSFSSSMIGMVLTYTTGVYGGLITAVGSTTSLTVNVSQTVSSTNYLISYPGLQVTSTGQTVTAGNARTSELITAAGALSPYLDSIIDSSNGSFTVTLANAATDQIKTVRLLYKRGFPITVSCSLGSFQLTTTDSMKMLRYNSVKACWQIEDSLSLTASNNFYVTTQQGTKLVGSGGVSTSNQGYSCTVSADGNTMALGGPQDNFGIGAVWIYTRSGSTWTQQGSKIIGTDGIGGGAWSQGSACVLSADGNTLAVGGNTYNTNVGAVWVFTRSGSTWSQQGSLLVGTGYTNAGSFGTSIAISADGNTLAAGSNADNTNAGAVWVFTRSGGTWTQQGTKLVGTGNTGTASRGQSCALSADGNTLAFGGNSDNTNVGAVWIFTRSGGTWTQQGTKLVGTGNTGASNQGYSCSLSADGNTLAVGGYLDNSNGGAVWIFTRTGAVWAQQGTKLVGTGNTGNAVQGSSCSLSADGNTLLFGGYGDNTNVGAVWVFTRSSSIWTQQGTKLVGTGNTGAASQGWSCALAADGNTVIVGAYQDNSYVGGAWVFI